jgi:DNA-directed RNA polymerase I, II, and III subunit RPABC2
MSARKLKKSTPPVQKIMKLKAVLKDKADRGLVETKDKLSKKDDEDEEFSDTEDIDLEDLELNELKTDGKNKNIIVIPSDVKEADKYEYKPVLQREIIIVPMDDRITSNILTKFEIARIISVRATQIEKNNECYVDVSGLSNPVDMAERELVSGNCPISIIRMLNETVGEVWHANEMTVL